MPFQVTFDRLQARVVGSGSQADVYESHATLRAESGPSALAPGTATLLAGSFNPAVVRCATKCKRHGDWTGVDAVLLREWLLASSVGCATPVIEYTILGSGLESCLTSMRGTPLDALLAAPGHAPDLLDRVEAAEQLVAFLKSLRAANLSHNDIKPSNIIAFEIRGAHVLRLGDFGSAHCEAMASAIGCHAPFPVASSGYRPPETALLAAMVEAHVAAHGGELTRAHPIPYQSADAWSTGCVCAEVLDGSHPFATIGPDSSSLEQLQGVLTVETPAVATVGADDVARAWAEYARPTLAVTPDEVYKFCRERAGRGMLAEPARRAERGSGWDERVERLLSLDPCCRASFANELCNQLSTRPDLRCDAVYGDESVVHQSA